MTSLRRARRLVLVSIVLAACGLTGAAGAAAAPEGTLTMGMHDMSPYEDLKLRR